MRTFLVLLGLLVVLVAAALAIFIGTFDADRFRPLLASRLSDALHRPVEVERLSLRWRDGVAIQVHGLTIGRADGRPSDPLLHVESASAVMRLLPLLRRRVEIASVMLVRPHLYVVRDAQGRSDLAVGAAGAPVAALGATVTVGQTPVSVSLQLDTLRIQQGLLRWADATTRPPTDVTFAALDATVRDLSLPGPIDLDARAALGAEAPNLSVRAHVRPSVEGRPGSIDPIRLTVEQLPLERLGPPAGRGEPQVLGTLSGTWEGRVDLQPALAVRTASGTGRLTLANPTLKNLNVLRMVFEKLSIIPGLVETLQSRLPPDYQAKFSAPDTVFSPIDVTIRLQQGWVRFDDLRLASDTFQLAGAGRIGLDGAVEIRSRLRIDQALSAAIFRSVEELRALAGPSGEMELPVTFTGHVPRIVVVPDLNEIASKVIVTKAVDALGGLLKRQQPAQEPGAPDALGGFLQQLLKQDTPNNGTPSRP